MRSPEGESFQLSTDSQLWNRIAIWIRRRLSGKLAHRIDVEQIVNDSLMHWLESSGENICGMVYDSYLPPLLQTIVDRRLKDAIKVESRMKRGGRVGFHPLYEDTASYQNSYVTLVLFSDSIQVLIEYLNRTEQRVSELRFLEYDDYDIGRLLGIGRAEVAKARRRIGRLANETLVSKENE